MLNRQKALLEKYYAGNVFSDSGDIESMRQELKVQIQKNKESGQDMFDEGDVERALNDDWQIRRFLVAHKGNAKKATAKLLKSLKWRKDFGVNSRSIPDLPIEFVRAGAIFPFFEDKEGRIVIYLRVKVNKKVS